MSEIVGYRPIRVSVKLLRDHIRDHGSSTLAELTDAARAEDPRLTSDLVAETLKAHPRVFTVDAAGRYGVIAEPEIRILRRGARRPESSAPRRGGTRSNASSTPAPQPPPSRWHRDGSVGSVVVPVGDLLHESGDRLLLSLPAAAPADDLQTLSVFVDETQSGRSLYRGERDVLSVDADADRCLIVVGPAKDLDLGRRLRVPLAAIEASGAAGSDSALAIQVWRVLEDPRSTRAREANRISPPSSRTAAAGPVSAARVRLQQVKDDPRRWVDFVNWMSELRSQASVDVQEQILRMALGQLSPSLHLDVAKLAYDQLGDQTPTSAKYAELLLPLMTELDFAHVDAAELLRLCREAGVQDPRLDLYSARIAVTERRPDDACDIYSSWMTDPSLADIVDYLCAADAASHDRGRRAVAETSRILLDPEKHRSDRRGCIEALGFLLQVIEDVGADVEPALSACVRLQLEERRWGGARHELAMWRSHLTLAQVLDVLSVYEFAEDESTLDWLIGQLQGLLGRLQGLAQVQLYREAFDQLRTLESLVGLRDHPFSDAYREDLEGRLTGSRASDPSASPVLGGRFTLVGGLPRTRERIAAQLRQRGAAEVREVPPHWEAHVDEKVMRGEVLNSGCTAVLLSDQVGHLEQQILRSLGAPMVIVSGGPSRVMRELEASLAGTA